MITLTENNKTIFLFGKDHQTRKVFDDLLGFRSLTDNYEDVLALQEIPELRVADLSRGKANDDGYRGIHVYF